MHKRDTKRNSLFFKARFEAALFQRARAVGFGGAGAEAPKRQGSEGGRRGGRGRARWWHREHCAGYVARHNPNMGRSPIPRRSQVMMFQ